MTGRLTTAAAAIVAIALVSVSLASACTAIRGTTQYSAASPTTGPPGTTISAYATGAASNSLFKLVVGHDGKLKPRRGLHACMEFEETAVSAGPWRSDVYGNIADASSPASGPIPEGLVPGVWHVCFYEITPGQEGATATAAASPLFTLTMI
ncbi:MAG TPA: hypothetical protein VNA57_12095 [Acidimicrobiales bacterium]|nr:hypothetical protein [Acidimicrobiales bacterium]